MFEILILALLKRVMQSSLPVFDLSGVNGSYSISWSLHVFVALEIVIKSGFKDIVLPAKSDSDVMFSLQSYQELESIDLLCINPIHRIGLIHKGSIDSH